MKKLYLVNSPVVIETGRYEFTEITSKEAGKLIEAADIIDSSIAYDEVAEIIFEISGKTIEVDKVKKVTTFREENCLIVACFLKHAITRTYTLEDYEFRVCRYARNNDK